MSPNAYLLILVPRQGFSRQHKPVLLGAALHQADIVDGQPTPADHLVGRTHLSRKDSLLPRPPYATPQNGWKPGSVAGLPPAPSQILAPYQPMQSQLGIRQAAGTGVGMDGDTDKQKANH